MSKCDYCNHAEMCGWRKDVEEQGCEFFDDGNKWIPYSERMPDTLGEYLITALSNPHKNRIVSTGYYHNRRKEFGTYRADASWEKWDVIAWMPLPEPWKGADDEQMD